MSGSPQTSPLQLWGVKLFTWSVTFIKMRDFPSYLNKTKQFSETGALVPTRQQQLAPVQQGAPRFIWDLGPSLCLYPHLLASPRCMACQAQMNEWLWP